MTILPVMACKIAKNLWKKRRIKLGRKNKEKLKYMLS